MPKKKIVAVVAHAKKTLGDGLSELRRVLAAAGHDEPLWFEVPKSSSAPRAIRRAVKKGAELIFVWGGDGMVQHCIDALAGAKKVEMAIIPAGTANLLATDLGIPRDIAKAVHIGMNGNRRRLDVGVMNGERFAVMAGAGFDSRIMRDVNGAKKESLGKLAYIRSGIDAMQGKPVRMTVQVDGEIWFKGMASTVLIGNIGTITGGLVVFPDASATDGQLEIGVVTAKSTWQWLRVLSRVARGHLERSPFIKLTRGKKIRVELGRELPYELDGGARPPVRRLKVRIKGGAVTMCVPAARARKRPSPPRPRIPTPRRAALPASGTSVVVAHASDGASAAPSNNVQ